MDLSSFVVTAPILRDDMVDEAEVGHMLGATPWSEAVGSEAIVRRTIRIQLRDGTIYEGEVELDFAAGWDGLRKEPTFLRGVGPLRKITTKRRRRDKTRRNK